MSEFYKQYRPKTLKGVVGQDAAVHTLQRLMDKGRVPHCLLLTGPSGCGKTTIARIVQTHLNCGTNDFLEINGADSRGVDDVRRIQRESGLAPISGDVRIWLIDECHKLTNDAQNAFLKLLEDTPKHVYFLLATTDPQKLLNTIKTRGTEIKLSLLSPAALERVVQRVVDKEQLDVSKNVVEEIVDCAEGSARKALVLLDQVAYVEGEEAQMKAVSVSSQAKDQAIQLARVLINPTARWAEAAKILKELKEEPESVRYLVLGYARSVLLGGGKLCPRAFKIIDIFSRNFYDSKHAGLAAACYETIEMK